MFAANTLSWSRLRTSTLYLLKADLGPREAQHLDQAVAKITERVNTQIHQFELPGMNSNRMTDLDAICRSTVILGRRLLSQPAVWKFKWRVASDTATGTRHQLVYFPCLVRLTDNKARKLRTPQVVLQARTASLWHLTTPRSNVASP